MTEKFCWERPVLLYRGWESRLKSTRVNLVKFCSKAWLEGFSLLFTLIYHAYNTPLITYLFVEVSCLKLATDFGYYIFWVMSIVYSMALFCYHVSIEYFECVGASIPIILIVWPVTIKWYYFNDNVYTNEYKEKSRKMLNILI